MKPLSSQLQPPGLYVVATPIGNLQDITLRALELLKAADAIACEDTRVSAKLLAAYGIRAPLIAYHDHSDDARREMILEKLRAGQKIALISDAGTPLISDPGYKLVQAARAAGMYVTVMPGASSLLAGLCLSGQPSDAFYFAGFLPAKNDARAKALAGLSAIDATLIFFESPKRLAASLTAMKETLGDRNVSVLREITKLHEECRQGTLGELCAHYEKTGAPKGEVVVVVAPPHAPGAMPEDALRAELQALLKTHTLKEAVQRAAMVSGRPRKEVYALALRLKE